VNRQPNPLLPRGAKRSEARDKDLNLIGNVAAFAGLGLGGLVLLLLHRASPEAAAGAVAFREPHMLAHFVNAYRQQLSTFAPSAMTLGPVLALVISSYTERRHFRTNAKRYERMLLLFGSARARLDEIAQGRPGDPKTVVRELGREALVEHADWLLMRRDRPLVALTDPVRLR
jgi:hypothetical protein